MGWRGRNRRERTTSEEVAEKDPAELTLTARVRDGNREVVFHLDNPRDVVQKVLLQGNFYESRILRSHQDFIFRGSTVLDIGANIGNHTVFYALHGAARVYPFEPNPRANALLRKSVAANGIKNVDMTHLECGVGDAATTLRVQSPNPNNLGKTILGESGDVEVPIRPLDDMPVEGRISLVKIDVEGMELAVLRGSERTIGHHRPVIAIEVDDENAGDFWKWADAHDYRVIQVVKRRPYNADFVCVPAGAVPSWTWASR
jgi:FkbM family methyltransferase